MSTNVPIDSKLVFAPANVAEPTLQPNDSTMNRYDRSLVRSVAWNAASDWGTQIFGWICFLGVMRMLTPADFGIVALANILMPYMGQITGLGLPRAVVALPKLSEDQLSQMFALNIFAGCFCFVVGLIIAKPLGAFFRTPALASVFIVACSGLVMGSLCGVPGALLAKEMRFRMLSILGIVTTLIGSALTLVLAWLGFRYWAIMLGNLLPGFIRIYVILRARPCRLAWPDFKSIREPLRFGWHISISIVAFNSYERLDNFVAGRRLGQLALGLYGNAWEAANVPLEKVASLVTTVIPIYLAAVQDSPAALRRYLRGATEVVALAAFPACVGLGLVARECVPVVLGHKWDGMVPALEVLSFYAAFRAIAALPPKVIACSGNARYVMWVDLFALVFLPVTFYIGSYWGITGIAWGWVVGYPFVVLPFYIKSFRMIGMKVGEYLRALRPALSGTIVMIPAVECIKYSLPATRSLLARLVLEVAAGAIAYMATVWLLHKERVQAVMQIARHLRPQKASSTTMSVA